MSLSFRRQLLLPLLIALTGFGLASVIDISNLPRQPFYEPFTYTLLAIGLYGSVYGIQLDELKNHNKLIVRAVTIGVQRRALSRLLSPIRIRNFRGFLLRWVE